LIFHLDKKRISPMPRLEEFDYVLPEDRIAQHPSAHREDSRLMVLHREPFALEHRRFHEIVRYLDAGDVLVLNETKVWKARLLGERVGTGGKVEVLLTDVLGDRSFLGVVKPAKRVRLGTQIGVGRATLRVMEVRPDGKRQFQLEGSSDIEALMDSHGQVPLPPYIRRPPVPEDSERYQTVFARIPGSIAAPTAGFHFTESVISELRHKGVILEMILLHVGLGTFRPIRSERVEDHRMDREYYDIPADTRERLRRSKEEGKRVVACGTTGVRALESWGFGRGSAQGWTDLFIYPPYEFKVVSTMITNFHLPKSTPLLMVSSFAGKDNILAAYKEALEAGYRFFSYGDAMLLL
jgi:S-adenosylmethionine:tRNA ribosyltransferase-isomerase